MKVRWLKGVCLQGHPTTRPFTRYLRIEMFGWEIVFSIKAKLLKVPAYVCGKCLGIS